jgi:hypothetical protein
VVQQHWPRRGNWPADDWDLDLAVFEDGQIVGLQNLAARDYAIAGKASAFSWPGLRHRAGASAPRCMPRSCTWPSPGSMRLKRPRQHSRQHPIRDRLQELGYELHGIERHAVRGRATTTRRLRLSRVQWQKNQRIPVSITGLARCRPLAGLEDDGRNELAAPADDAFRSPQMH